MDLTKIKKIYMIGIKGVGMTMLAQFFASLDIEVLGSDIDEKFMTDDVLKKSGIEVIERFDKKNIPADADVIIYSSAYTAKNNREVKAAINGKIKIMTYAEAMGGVFNQRHGIAVVGSHGKTTTTAWLGFVLREAGLDPSVMVGAQVPQFDGAAVLGKSDYLIIEADEYQNKLKSFSPRAVLLNNIDYDHPDFFKTEEEYNQVFIDFIKKIPSKGFLVTNWDDKNIRSIARVNTQCKVITYAINEVADVVAYDIVQKDGLQYFKVKFGIEDGGDSLGDFSIQLSGKHNISNALAVIATCVEMGVDLVDIRKYLPEFAGTARRMQVLGKFNGATIIDDYAHHPTEIKATLAGAREKYGKKNIKVIFHPHTFTRTKAFLDDFATSFEDADEVIILDIYGSAREEHGGVHSRDLVKKILQNHDNAFLQYISNLKGCEKYLRESIERDDIVILMGAGDVFKIGENLVK